MPAMFIHLFLNWNDNKSELLTNFSRRSLAFDELIDDCCDDNELREPDYRKALKQLRDEQKIMVMAVTSKTAKGLSGKDRVVFP